MKERGLRSIAESLKQQLWISISGFHDRASFLALKEVFGIDRILYSADYPYNYEDAKSFFDIVELSEEDASKIAFRNAKNLLQLSSAQLDLGGQSQCTTCGHLKMYQGSVASISLKTLFLPLPWGSVPHSSTN